MEIFIESKRKKNETIKQKYPDSKIIDVTSKSNYPWIKFSPFYPHENIPIPFSEPLTGASVEGIWQGLKVFEKADIDINIINRTSMNMLKRTIRKYGKIIGHRDGINGVNILSYLDARQKIYLPCYEFVLSNCLKIECESIQEILNHQSIVLLDYETNDDIFNLDKPLSHASLIRKFVTTQAGEEENQKKEK
jgi:hypothetical protein